MMKQIIFNLDLWPSLKDSTAPSTANLLDEECDGEELLPREETQPDDMASGIWILIWELAKK